jgi:hypothetical protein
MKIWRIRIACWATKPINTHSEYVIPISFPLQQLLQEGTSMLRYTYIACVVCHAEGYQLERKTISLFATHVQTRVQERG